MTRTTVLLPKSLHKRLREEAFRSRLESATKPKKRGKPRLDPLIRVAGLCDGRPITSAIDEELYHV